MKHPEIDLLESLGKGEILRFVLSRNDDDEIRCRVEGAHSGTNSAAFSKRLDFLLQRLRKQGLAFAPGKSAEKNEPKGQMQWLEIRPKALLITSPAKSNMGFQEITPTLTPNGEFCVSPDFSSVSMQMERDDLFHLVRDAAAIAQIEIEFTPRILEKAEVSQIQNALKNWQAENPHLSRDNFDDDCIGNFLNQWLNRGSGWNVVLRVALGTGSECPTAAIEHLGRICYGCPCEIINHHAVIPSQEPEKAAIDLCTALPAGWSLPSLLPRDADQDLIDAKPLHHSTRPKLPKSGSHIGMVDQHKVLLPRESRDRHTYIVGGTGTGKSTLLSHMIREDIQRGEGVILLDPHGDLYNEIAATVPTERRKDLVKINPLDPENCPGFNLLDIPDGKLRRRHAELMIGELIQCFQRIWGANKDAFGPMFETYFRAAMELLIYQEGAPHTLPSFERVFFDRDFRKELLSTCTETAVRDFWTGIADKAGGEASLSNIAPYITSKLYPLLRGAFLSTLFCANRDDLQMPERINQKPILLVNLNKGVLGENESRILGVVILSKIMAAGISRSLLRPEDRSPVNLYVDEFQNFVSGSVATMVSEARKFGLRLTFANQNLAQLNATGDGNILLETVLGNVGNQLIFRLGVKDAQRLNSFFHPFDPKTMQELPNFHCLCRLLTAEGPFRPFIMQTLPPD